MRDRCGVLTAVFLLAGGLLPAPWQARAAAEPLTIDSEKQLFLDDRVIESSTNVERVMNPPYQPLEPVLIANAPWELAEHAHVWNSATVRKEDGKIRLWYHLLTLREEARETGPVAKGEYVAYAESEDGIHFVKPELGLHEFGGTTANSIVIPNCRGVAAWLDPQAPPEARYRTQTKGPQGRLTFHHSPDGIHWELTRAIDIGDCDTQSMAFWDETLGRYVLYTRKWVRFENKSHSYRYHRRMESNDLEHWDNEVQVLGADEADLATYETSAGQPPVDYYGACVFRYPDSRGMYVMVGHALWHWFAREPLQSLGPDQLDDRLCAGRDGKEFARLGGRLPFLRPGPGGTWFSRHVWTSSAPIEMGNELWLYYWGSNMDHAGNIDPAARGEIRCGLGRAILRLDGFVSLDAGYAWGEFTTPPLIFAGDSLALNVDTGAGGVAFVEILDAEGAAIEGFSRAEAVPACGNDVALRAKWTGAAALGALGGKPVRLRFSMRDCKLYAFQFMDSAESR
ncbi:MAG TPA: hypothetical protein PLM14_07330 [Candidatus Hydrogenedentes bacterium]|nr:hypothetical protein [Candidatus Hydrogenedentota bacterium]